MNHVTDIIPVDTPARIVILGGGPLAIEAALYARFLGYAVDLYTDHQVLDECLEWLTAAEPTAGRDPYSSLGIAALRAQSGADNPPALSQAVTPEMLCLHYFVPLTQTDLLSNSMHSEWSIEQIMRLTSMDDDESDREIQACDTQVPMSSEAEHLDTHNHPQCDEADEGDDDDDNGDNPHFELHLREGDHRHVVQAEVIVDARTDPGSSFQSLDTARQAQPIASQRVPHYYRLAAAKRGHDALPFAQGRDEIRALFAGLADRADLDLYARLAALAR